MQHFTETKIMAMFRTAEESSCVSYCQFACFFDSVGQGFKLVNKSESEILKYHEIEQSEKSEIEHQLVSKSQPLILLAPLQFQERAELWQQRVKEEKSSKLWSEMLSDCMVQSWKSGFFVKALWLCDFNVYYNYPCTKESLLTPATNSSAAWKDHKRPISAPAMGRRDKKSRAVSFFWDKYLTIYFIYCKI